MPLTAEERTLKGSYIGTCVPVRDLPRYVSLYRQGRLPVNRLMSGRLALEEINAGFDRMADGKAVRASPGLGNVRGLSPFLAILLTNWVNNNPQVQRAMVTWVNDYLANGLR